MEKFLLSNFTAEQKWILTRRFQGISYTRIRETWPFGERQSLHNQNIISCVRRSALGYAWRAVFTFQYDVQAVYKEQFTLYNAILLCAIVTFWRREN